MARQNFYEQQMMRTSPRSQRRSPYDMQMNNASPMQKEPMVREEEEMLDNREDVRDPNAPVVRPRPRPVNMAGDMGQQMNQPFNPPMFAGPVVNGAFDVPGANPYMMQQTYMNPYMNMYGQPMQPLQGMGQDRLSFANRLLMR